MLGLNALIAQPAAAEVDPWLVGNTGPSVDVVKSIVESQQRILEFFYSNCHDLGISIVIYSLFLLGFRFVKDLNAFELEKKDAMISAKRAEIALMRKNGAAVGTWVSEVEGFSRENSGEVQLKIPLASLSFLTQLAGTFAVFVVCN